MGALLLGTTAGLLCEERNDDDDDEEEDEDDEEDDDLSSSSSLFPSNSGPTPFAASSKPGLPLLPGRAFALGLVIRVLSLLRIAEVSLPAPPSALVALDDLSNEPRTD